MIKYHGTPLGGKNVDKPAFFTRRHALVSFAYQQDMEVVAECCESFVFDCGAYSAWRSGKPVTDWRPYYEFCKKWIRHPGFDWLLMPDIIDGDEAQNDAEITKFVNWDGWRGGERWHLNAKAVPVWHLHESLTRLDRLSRAWPRVAFGSSGEFAEVGSDKWETRINEAFETICIDGQVRCKTHGLRMMDPSIFRKFPFASVDSTNVAQNQSREAQRHNTNEVIAREIIAARIESHNSAQRYVPQAKQEKMFT